MSHQWINAVIQEIAEMDDRSSPPDWPEAMLVTADELTEIICRHAPTKSEAPGPTIYFSIDYTRASLTPSIEFPHSSPALLVANLYIKEWQRANKATNLCSDLNGQADDFMRKYNAATIACKRLRAEIRGLKAQLKAPQKGQ